MCGIFGQWLPGPDATAVPPEGALADLRHRGPDDSGVATIRHSKGLLTLTHTRLAIIDLSSSGHQPMQTADGRFTLIYNGEVYNYREIGARLRAEGVPIRGQSDTEVLLAAWAHWGQGIIPQLKGMFAFAVFDAADGVLTLARDAFGIKPLFIARTQDAGIVFGSEIWPVLDALRHVTLDRTTAYHYLVWGDYDRGQRTFFNEIQHLPPGHVLTLPVESINDAKPIRWWTPEDAHRVGWKRNDVVEAVRSQFLDNVRLHLRSDVPVGAALSGGVDSASVVCAMRFLEPDLDIESFTFTSPGSPVDEERWADFVNRHVDARPHKVLVRPGDLARDINKMVRAQGEPFGSTSIYAQFRVMEAARDSGVTVVLEGQGADEMFGGYHGYPGARIQSLLDAGQYRQALRFLNAWRAWPGRSVPRALADLAVRSVPAHVAAMMVPLAPRRRPDWLRMDMLPAGLAHEQMEDRVAPTEREMRLRGVLQHSMSRRGLPALLRHSDRNGMHWSVESRVPFLTTDLAELCLSLPEDLLVSAAGETKSVLRAAMRGIVPDNVLDRRDKIGLATPEQSWLGEVGHELLAWVDAAEYADFLDVERCREHVSETLRGRSRGEQTWRLLNYCRWLELVSPYLD